MDSFEAYFLQGLTDGIKKEAQAPTESPLAEIIKKAKAKLTGGEGPAKAEGSLLKALLNKGK